MDAASSASSSTYVGGVDPGEESRIEEEEEGAESRVESVSAASSATFATSAENANEEEPAISVHSQPQSRSQSELSPNESGVLPPPPAPPTAVVPDAPTVAESNTIWDLQDLEAIERCGQEAEMSIMMAGLAKKMRKDQQDMAAKASDRIREATDNLTKDLLEMVEEERTRRRLLEESEEDTWSDLTAVIRPVMNNILDKVEQRLRRIRRRQRKIDALKHLKLTKQYEQELSEEARKRRSESEWNQFIQTMYIRDARRLENAARIELEAKFAAAEAELSIPSKELQLRSRDTLYESLNRKVASPVHTFGPLPSGPFPYQEVYANF